MPLPRVSYITPTMNRVDNLRRMLRCLQAQDYPDKEIIVVDNGSQDNTAAMVLAEFPEVVLIRLNENQGVPGGRNRGIEKATGSIFVFIDDDVELIDVQATRKAVEAFTAFPDAGGFALLSLDPDTLKPHTNHIPRQDKKKLAGKDISSYHASRCAMFIGGNSVFRKEVFDKVGLFWEQLNPYGGEDFDLTYRLVDAGYSLYWLHDPAVLHHESKLERTPWRGQFYFTRNRPWITVRHLPWHYVMVNVPVWLVLMGLRMARSGHAGYYLKAGNACRKGMKDAVLSRKVISKEAIAYYKAHSGCLWY